MIVTSTDDKTLGINLIPENDEERKLIKAFRIYGIKIGSYYDNNVIQLIHNDRPKPMTISKEKLYEISINAWFTKMEAIILAIQRFSVLTKDLENNEFTNDVLSKLEEKFMNKFIDN